MMVAITLNVATRRRLALVFGNITAVPENVGQANGRSDSHGGTIKQWVSLTLMIEVANIPSGNYHYVYDYGSGGRLGILLICWIFDWNVQCMGIENNSTRYANGLGFKELLEQLARESHAMSTTPIILYEGDFTRRDDRYVVRQRRRALVYVNNYGDCMLSINRISVTGLDLGQHFDQPYCKLQSSVSIRPQRANGKALESSAHALSGGAAAR